MQLLDGPVKNAIGLLLRTWMALKKRYEGSSLCLSAAHQYDALVSFTYNVGEGNLAKSTLLKRVNAGDHAGAANEFLKWNKAGGKTLAGLTRRRKSESLLYQGVKDENYDGIADPKPPTGPMAQTVDIPEDQT